MRDTTRSVLVFSQLISGEWVTTSKISAETKYTSDDVLAAIGKLISNNFKISNRINSDGESEWQLEGVWYWGEDIEH